MRRSTIAALNLIALGLIIVVSFNNCQPMKAVDDNFTSSSSNGGGTGGGQTQAGAQYFESTVKPTFQLLCSSCHALPKDVTPPNIMGPLSIFTYATMRDLMMPGPSATNNPLFNKVRNQVAHGGGDMCVGDVSGSVSPCRELKNWATLEFPLFVEGIAGTIVNVTATGSIRGWALDTRNPATALTINIYVGGAAGAGGTLVASVPANLPGDGIQQNGHYFNYQLPANLADGVPRDFYFYGGAANAANLLPGMPQRIVAYTPRQAGRTFYNNTVAPALQVCVGCHGNIDYDTRYYSLVSPLPANGGTANNNELIVKMMGGQNHGGGNQCAGGNASRCDVVRQWWAIEFQ